MEIITLSTKSQMLWIKEQLSVVFRTFFLLSVVLYYGEKSLFKLYGCVVLFQTESISLS